MKYKDLENRLAEVQVLAEELKNRTPSDRSNYNPSYAEDPCRLIDDIILEMGNFYKDYKKVIKGINKKGSNYQKQNLERSVNDFGFTAKALSENVSGYLQTLYGNKEPTPKNLTSEVCEKAPKLSNGKNIYELFSQVHDYNPENPLMKFRNCKSHSLMRRNLIKEKSSDKGYFIDLNGNSEDLEKWITDSFDAYSTMTRDILKTIADNETERLNSLNSNKKRSIKSQKRKNWRERHKTPIKIALASALVATGIVGTLAYQKISDIEYRNYLEKNLYQIENSLIEDGARFNESFFDVQKKFYEFKISNLEEENKKLKENNNIPEPTLLNFEK